MRKVLLLVTVLAALGLAPVANAGCWATVKLSSMPTGKSVWNVRVTPLQHGRTSLYDAKPRVETRNGSGKWIVFRARQMATKPGTYFAKVSFPSAGSWRIRVWDGFEPYCARYHTYTPVVVGLR